METIFASIFVGDYFRIPGTTEILHKVDPRTAWAFREFYKGCPVYHFTRDVTERYRHTIDEHRIDLQAWVIPVSAPRAPRY